jgi:hypothetical protein
MDVKITITQAWEKIRFGSNNKLKVHLSVMPLHNPRNFVRRFNQSQRDATIKGMRASARRGTLSQKRVGELFEREIFRLAHPYKASEREEYDRLSRITYAYVSVAMVNVGLGKYYHGKSFQEIKRSCAEMVMDNPGGTISFVESLAKKIGNTQKEKEIIEALNKEILAIREQIKRFVRRKKK